MTTHGWKELFLEIKKTLDSELLPAPAPDCDYCTYREYVGKKLMAFAGKTKKPKGKNPSESDTK